MYEVIRATPWVVTYNNPTTRGMPDKAGTYPLHYALSDTVMPRIAPLARLAMRSDLPAITAGPRTHRRENSWQRSLLRSQHRIFRNEPRVSSWQKQSFHGEASWDTRPARL
ncbi:hypothetical protein KM043_008328 [Ampulex compressa]|nr:hypothetical protein KM043_008328 [Ampulex compressa]